MHISLSKNVRFLRASISHFSKLMSSPWVTEPKQNREMRHSLAPNHATINAKAICFYSGFTTVKLKSPVDIKVTAHGKLGSVGATASTMLWPWPASRLISRNGLVKTGSKSQWRWQMQCCVGHRQGRSRHDSPQLKACGSKQRRQRWWPMVVLRLSSTGSLKRTERSPRRPTSSHDCGE